MLDVLLVNPPLTPQERYGELAEAGSSMPNLGLLSLAAVARKIGAKVGVLEAGALNLSWQQTLEQIKTLSPALLGITCVTLSFQQAAQLAKEAKELLPKVSTVIGGPHFTALPEFTMQNYPQFDLGVRGEGEQTFSELLSALATKAPLSAVKGIYYRNDNQVVFSGQRDFILNLDQLPFPAWDLLAGFPVKYNPPIFRYLRLPAASLVISRGCPYHCIYCDRSVFGNRIRSFTPGYIMEMLQILKTDYKVKELLFEDDTFFLFKDRLKEVCELMVKEKLNFTWSCLARADMIDKQLLALMKKSGCWQIAFGIESGVPEILECLQKKIAPETVEKAVKLTRKSGILSKGFFILGSPLETKQTFRRTLDFAKRIELDDFSLFKLTPFPGSKIYEIAGQYGKFDRDWQKMNLLTTVFVPEGLSNEEMDKLNKQALKEFYLRPKIVFSYLKRIFRYPAYLAKVLTGLKALLKGIS